MLYAEIEDVTPTRDLVTHDRISKMTYLDMVIIEALRYYPPAGKRVYSLRIIALNQCNYTSIIFLTKKVNLYSIQNNYHKIVLKFKGKVQHWECWQNCYLLTSTLFESRLKIIL